MSKISFNIYIVGQRLVSLSEFLCYLFVWLYFWHYCFKQVKFLNLFVSQGLWSRILKNSRKKWR